MPLRPVIPWRVPPPEAPRGAEYDRPIDTDRAAGTDLPVDDDRPTERDRPTEAERPFEAEEPAREGLIIERRVAGFVAEENMGLCPTGPCSAANRMVRIRTQKSDSKYH